MNVSNVHISEAVVSTYVDDLEALLEKLVSFFWEVVLDATLGCTVRLIDVDSFAWATQCSGPVAGVFRSTADCMVEDEHTSGSSSVKRC